MNIARSVFNGIVAGAAGTLAMDALLYARYRQGGGDQAPLSWETAEGADSWEGASAPAQVARKLAGVAGVDLPATSVRTVTNAMHWAYGSNWGSVLGLAGAKGSARRRGFGRRRLWLRLRDAPDDRDLQADLGVRHPDAME